MKRVMIAVLALLGLVVSCAGSTEPTGTESAEPDTGTEEQAAAPEADDPAPPSDIEPELYIPAGRPGSEAELNALVGELEQIVPVGLRPQVPWPDLRNPDPVVAQIEIFELWIWMAETFTEPRLTEIMAAPGSPSRLTVLEVFGRLEADNVFQQRSGEQYRAFDHQVITFESAGLPLWLARDVPDDAVVIYYADSSGPVDVVDQDTGRILQEDPGQPTRAWLSIMVPTDIGWQLWRDQLIEPNDAELQVPDIPPPPGADSESRAPEL